jgi:hypothetical protein
VREADAAAAAGHSLTRYRIISGCQGHEVGQDVVVTCVRCGCYALARLCGGSEDECGGTGVQEGVERISGGHGGAGKRRTEIRGCQRFQGGRGFIARALGCATRAGANCRAARQAQLHAAANDFS